MSAPPPPPALLRRARLPVALLVALAAVAVAAAFAWNVRRWWFLNDDAFITFRYARHLVEGHGLVWNPGERVEGYSEPSFALLMALVIALGGAPELWSNVLLIASGVGVLALVVHAGARRHGLASPWCWLPPLALALNRVFAAWSTSGMASQLFTFLLLGGYLRLARERETPGRSHAGGFLWLALATLTRPEGLMFTGLAGALLLVDVARGRTRLLRLLASTLPFLLLVGGHVLWRRAWYGDWLPNTFHAKVAGFYGEQGLRYLLLFFDDFPFWAFAPALLLLLRAPRRFEHALFAAAIGAQLVWLFWIGGDWHEFRFLLPLLPMGMLLFADAFARLAALFAGRPVARRIAGAAAGAAALALLAVVQLGSHRPEAQQTRDWIISVDKMASYTRRKTREGLDLRELVESGKLPADLLLGVGGAGALPWYSRLPCVDLLGLNDREVARTPIAARGVVGHERHAPLEYLARRRVAVIDAMNMLVWRGSPDEFPRAATIPPYLGLPLHCVALGRKRWLLFGTTLPEEELRRLFAGLEFVF